jgi:hypothetical protein
MIKGILVFISFIAIQAQAKTNSSYSKNFCSKKQIQFFLDGKQHCLDINAPITDSDYDRPAREISNLNSDIRTFR